MKKTLSHSINWEWVQSIYSKEEDGPVKADDPWIVNVLAHARDNGYRGKCTMHGLARTINKNLWK